MKHLLALILSTALPSIASAQDVTYSGGVTIGWGDQDMSRASDINGRLDFDLGNGLSFGADVGYVKLGFDNTPVGIKADFIGVRGAYKLQNGLSFGTFAEKLTTGMSLVPVDLSLTTYGLTVGYESEGLEIGTFIGQTGASPDILFGTNAKNYGLTVKYTAVPKLDVGATFVRAKIDNASIDFAGVAAAYDFNDTFTLFGGISNGSVDMLDLNVTTFGLGVGYKLPEFAGVNSTVSIELARTKLRNAGDLDTIRLGLSIPLGTKASKVPHNSVADAILNPRHGAFNAILTSAF